MRTFKEKTSSSVEVIRIRSLHYVLDIPFKLDGKKAIARLYEMDAMDTNSSHFTLF